MFQQRVTDSSGDPKTIKKRIESTGSSHVQAPRVEEYLKDVTRGRDRRRERRRRENSKDEGRMKARGRDGKMDAGLGP